MREWRDIIVDEKRYPDLVKGMPVRILVFGTDVELEEIAHRLSSWYSGCDDIFLVSDL